MRSFVGPFGACSCLSAFVMVSCSGQAVSFAEFPDCLRSLGPGAQMYYSVVFIQEIHKICSCCRRRLQYASNIPPPMNFGRLQRNKEKANPLETYRIFSPC